jgi:hypothetical protein
MEVLEKYFGVVKSDVRGKKTLIDQHQVLCRKCCAKGGIYTIGNR